MNTNELKKLELQELEEISGGENKEQTDILKLAAIIVTGIAKIFS